MRFPQVILTLSLLIALVLFGTSNVAAQQYLSQGVLQGVVLGSGLGQEPQPIDWALIAVRGNQSAFEVFSGMSGFYQIFLSAGTYDITISVPVDPSYIPYHTTVNITATSTSVMDFSLQRVWTPVYT